MIVEVVDVLHEQLAHFQWHERSFCGVQRQVKQVFKVKSGVDSDTAKKIQRLLKDSKLKVQAAIQGDAVRVTGAKRDDLQAAMAIIRKDLADLPLSFDNFRD